MVKVAMILCAQLHTARSKPHLMPRGKIHYSVNTRHVDIPPRHLLDKNELPTLIAIYGQSGKSHVISHS